MKTTIHRSTTRGHGNHGWLDTSHTFSFGNYYDPDRIQFGALRVLNDDVVSGGMGFGMHPHNNMEIISIPLKGDLEHKDSMGNAAIIKENDVQIMSAGTGIRHSEYNRNKDQKVNFLQIWILPKEYDITPRYEQKTFAPEQRVNKLQQIVSAEHGDDGIWINQDAWLYLGKLHKGFTAPYSIKKTGNGCYIFVIAGEVTANGEQLKKRDGLAVPDSLSISIEANSEAEVLIIDVPMTAEK